MRSGPTPPPRATLRGPAGSQSSLPDDLPSLSVAQPIERPATNGGWWGNATAPTSSALLRSLRLYPRHRVESRCLFLVLLMRPPTPSSGAAPPPSGGAPDRDRHPEAGRDALGGDDVAQRAGRHQGAAAHEPTVGEPGRYLLAVVGHQDDRRALGVARPARPAAPATAPGRPGRGRRTARPAGPAPDRSSAPGPGGPVGARLRRSPRTPGPRSPATPPRTKSRSAFSQSCRPVLVPPGFQRTVTAADHHVEGGHVRPELPGDRTADQGHAGTERPDVDPAQARAREPRPIRPSATAGPLPPGAASSCPTRSVRGPPSGRRPRPASAPRRAPPRRHGGR